MRRALYDAPQPIEKQDFVSSDRSEILLLGWLRSYYGRRNSPIDQKWKGHIAGIAGKLDKMAAK